MIRGETISWEIRGAPLRKFLSNWRNTTICEKCNIEACEDPLNTEGRPRQLEFHHKLGRKAKAFHHWTEFEGLCPNCHSQTKAFRNRIE